MNDNPNPTESGVGEGPDQGKTPADPERSKPKAPKQEGKGITWVD